MVQRYHFGRLFDHVHLKVSDLEASRRFYRAALEPLGVDIEEDDFHLQADELYVSEGHPVTTGLHLAFQARSEDTVRAFHRAAVDAGGRDNGAPGPRPYKPGYYAAFVLDPDGNNVEAVRDGMPRRSADSVVMEWDG